MVLLMKVLEILYYECATYHMYIIYYNMHVYTINVHCQFIHTQKSTLLIYTHLVSAYKDDTHILHAVYHRDEPKNNKQKNLIEFHMTNMVKYVIKLHRQNSELNKCISTFDG